MSGIQFDLVDAFLVVSPLTVAGSLITGLQAGAFYAYHQRLGVNAYTSVVLSTMFFLTMSILRLVEGSATWERWIGAWLLSILFAGSMHVGFTLRARIAIMRSRSR